MDDGAAPPITVRFGRAADELGWLPPAVRQARWRTSGAIWGGAGVLAAGLVVAVPPVLLAWKVLATAGVGVAVVGERAGAAAFRRALAKLTRGELPLGALGAEVEGQVVCVRGKIAPGPTIAGALHDGAGVYRRLRVDAGGAWLHEAVLDFDLVDEAGARVRVQAGGARWLAPARELESYPAARFERDPVPAEVRDRVRAGGSDRVPAAERLLLVGDVVQVVGAKTTTAAVDGATAGFRQPPQRATLTSSATLPVVISRVVDLDEAGA